MAFGNSFDLKAVLTADIGQFQSAMKQASNAMKDVQSSADTLGSMGKTIAGLGAALTAGITVPAVAAASASVKLGSEFQTSMSKVQAISGATSQEMEVLESTAREMGATTRYSASEAADALSYMALAGWDTQQMTAALPSVLNLATAGQIDLARASDIVTDMMSMFGLEANEASRAADVFAAAQANSNLSVDQLGEALVKAGPTAASYGATIEETSAMLGLFANAGLKGSRAGTTLDAMYRDLTASAENGTIAIGDTAVAVYDANGELRPMADIMADVEKATVGMTDEQKQAALSSIFQQQAMRGANIVLNEGTDSLYDLQGQLKNSTGAAEEMANVMDDNVEGAFLNFKSSLEELGLTLYDLIKGPLQGVLEKATEIVDWFNQLDSGTQAVVFAFVGLAAAVGPILVVLGGLLALLPKIVEGARLVAEGMSLLSGLFGKTGIFGKLLTGALGLLKGAFSALLGPIGLVVAAIGIFVAALIHLWQTNEQVRSFITAIWEGISSVISTVVAAIASFITTAWDVIQEVTSTVWSFISEIIGQSITAVSEFIMQVFGQVVDWWRANNENILTVASTAWNAISTVISTVWSVISTVISTGAQVIWSIMQALWPGIQSLVEVVWNLISTIISNNLNVILGIVGVFAAILTGDWQGLWNSIQQILSAVISTLGAIVQAGFGIIQTIITTIMNAVQAVIASVWNVIQSIFSAVIGVIGTIVSTGFNAIKTVISTIMNAISTVISTIWNAIGNVVTTVVNAIQSVVISGFNAVRSVVTSVMNAVKSVVTRVWNAIKSVTTSVINGIKSVVQSGFNAMKSVITSVMNAIRSVVSSVWNAVRTIFTTVLSGIISFVTSSFNRIRSTITNVMNAVRNIISNILNAIRNTFQRILSTLANIVRSSFNRVKSAVTNGMNSALNAVKSFFGRFRQAGANIITNIANGIKSAAGKVVGAAKNVMQSVRNILPFSPPKDKSSPLVDIHKNGIIEQIAKGIYNNAGDLKKATIYALGGIEDTLNNQSLNADLGLDAAINRANAKVNGHVDYEFGQLDINRRPAQINLSIGGHTFTAFVEDISNEQGRIADLDAQF